MSGRTLAYVLPITDAGDKVKGVVVAELNLDLLTERIAPMIYQSYILFTKEGSVINRLDSRDKLPLSSGLVSAEAGGELSRAARGSQSRRQRHRRDSLNPLVAVKSTKTV